MLNAGAPGAACVAVMTVLIPGETCWREVQAERAAFLVDVEAYFSAVYAALSAARRSILLIGWGFDPRTRLFPDGEGDAGHPDEVGQVLLNLARTRPDLDVRVLIWRSAFPINASQEFFPHRARRWFKGSRVHFRLDDMIPYGACHHQKVLVIDDKVAFCGGADLGVDRWDTPRHLDEDSRRLMPDHQEHPARHEVMMLVEGDAARALGDLARERWFRACGERLSPPGETASDPWPDAVPAHMTNAQVAISRTEPAWRGAPLVDEVRRLNRAAIASATSTIYLENQYFTAPGVAEALAVRLAEPDGPEVVLVSTGESPSWFDRATMDRTRAILIWRLQAADVYGRFRAWRPMTRGGKTVIVHSKLGVIDERLVWVGSANLNNRSGGFDTECQLAVAGRTLDQSQAIAAFRDRLLGHFLGATGEAVTRTRLERGSLIAAVEALNGEGRLAPITPRRMTAAGRYIAERRLGDPCGVGDSWRPGRRKLLLDAEVREIAARRG